MIHVHCRGLSVLPYVVISHHKGFAEWLSGVEPDSGVFLHCSSELSGDGCGAGVQGTGDCREQRFV